MTDIRLGPVWRALLCSLVLAFVLVALKTVVLLAFTCGQGQSYDESANGYAAVMGVTYHDSCPSGRVYWVAVFIDGPNPFTCEEDACSTINKDSNAVETAFLTSQIYYGTFTGHGQHKYADTPCTAAGVASGDCSVTWSTMTTSQKTLYTGESPEDQCADQDGYWDGSMCFYSPIIISTGTNSKYKLTSAQDGVLFDLDGDGIPERTAWTEADSDVSFLALDRDGDGRITSGKELFGNFTVPGASNGFKALQRLAMETNGGILRGSVTSEDPIFEHLLLWNDANHNGVSEPWELRPASSVLSAIGLGYQSAPRRDGSGNRFRYRGWVHLRTAPGQNPALNGEDNRLRSRYIWDVLFAVSR